MAAKFIMYMVLLTLGSSDPLPDPGGIQIDVQQKVYTGCRGSGCNDKNLNDDSALGDTSEIDLFNAGNLCERMGGGCVRPNEQCPTKEKKRPIRYYKRTLTLKYCGIEGTSPMNPTDCCAPAAGPPPEGSWVYKVDLENALLFALTNNIQYNALDVNTTNGEKRKRRYYKEDTRNNIINFLRLIITYLGNSQFQEHTVKFLYVLFAELDAIGEFSVDQLQTKLNEIQSNSNGAYLSAWQPSVACQCTRSTACYMNNWLYTCGIWQMFHTITVLAYDDDNNLKVIEIIGGYVSEFTDCNTCLIHFNEMYEQTVGKDPSKVNDRKDGAILWLWCAHNFVNQVSTKSYPPSPRFPLSSACPDCWSDKETNCAQLFCPDGEHNCWATSQDQGVNIMYPSFSVNAVVEYLVGTYGETYNALNTNNEWIYNLFEVNDECPSKRYKFE